MTWCGGMARGRSHRGRVWEGTWLGVESGARANGHGVGVWLEEALVREEGRARGGFGLYSGLTLADIVCLE